MTQPTGSKSEILTMLQSLQIAVPTREEYFEHIPFADQTLAKAEDVNQMQRNIEKGFDEFGEDVTFSLDQMRMALTAFANLLLARQAAFEASTDQKIADFIAKVEAEIATWKKYADDGDAATLKEAVAQAKKYTDEEIKLAKSIALQQAWKATHISLKSYAAGVNDGSNYFGGKPWGVPIVVVPVDHYFLITYYGATVLDLGDVGGAADEMAISWTPFFGLTQNAAGYPIQAAAGMDQPGWVLTPGTTSSAYVYINNLKATLQFVLEGYWVPNHLIAAAAADPNFPREWMGPLAVTLPPPRG